MARKGIKKMKNTFLLAACGTLCLVTLRANPPQAASPLSPGPETDRAPVLVELFTSEGCSTCPPADTLLSKLESLQPIDGAQIIALEEHVDYWNHDGWVDSYSSPDWTLRQQAYVDRFKGKSPFTPQMVVDGQSQFVGNNPQDAQAAIQEAAHRLKTQISITGVPSDKGDAQRFEIRVGNRAGAATEEPADVWIAVTEDGLRSSVKAGENAGKDLSHVATLRYLHKAGSAPAKDSSPLVLTQQVKFKASWKKENLHIVVFVQERKSLHVLGAASVRIAG
jgi:hypothetical protein